MNKLFDYFFEKLALWKVWLINLLWSSLMVYGMFHLLMEHLTYFDTPTIKICLCIGGLMSLFTTFTIWMVRKSSEWWDEANQLSKDIENSKTKKEIDLCYDKLITLNKKSLGRAHWAELNKLNAIIKTKREYLPQ
jgi:hypothetical protein